MMLCDVNRLGSQQSEPTEATDALMVHIINYAATFPHVQSHVSALRHDRTNYIRCILPIRIPVKITYSRIL